MTNKTESEEMVLIPKWEYEKLKAMQERIEDSEIIKLRYTQGYNQEQMSWDYAQGLSNADDCVDSGVLAIQKYVKGEMM
jgi:hypothetical protein